MVVNLLRCIRVKFKRMGDKLKFYKSTTHTHTHTYIYIRYKIDVTSHHTIRPRARRFDANFLFYNLYFISYIYIVIYNLHMFHRYKNF